MSVQEPHPQRVLICAPAVAEDVVSRRKRLGLDRYDEVWDGVYRVIASPSPEHDRVVTELTIFLGVLVKDLGLGRVGVMNVREPGTGEREYRIPDLIFISNMRMSIISEFGTEGGPDLAVEVRSPGDDTYEKIPFYGKVGVRELVVVDRNTKKVELFRSIGGTLLPVSSAPDGSLVCETLPIRLRRTEGADGQGALEVAYARDLERRVTI